MEAARPALAITRFEASFRILPPLYELNGASVVVPTKGGECQLAFVVTDSGQSMVSAIGNVTVPGDDLGALHNTIVTLTVPSNVDVFPAAHGRPSDLQRVAMVTLNLVIDHYRHVVQAPQIRRLPAKHLRGFTFRRTYADGKVDVGQFLGGNALRPGGDPAPVNLGSPELVARIQEGLKRGPRLPLWVSLYHDALADFGADNLRSGLAHLYMSFEMLANVTCRRLGTTAVGAGEVERFLSPSGSGPPVIYAVVKQCREWSASGPSKTKVKKDITALWKYRNDILHGRAVLLPADIEAVTIEAFRQLGGWLETAKPLAGKPRASLMAGPLDTGPGGSSVSG